MNFKLISLFPNFFNSPLKESLLAKAIEKGLIKIDLINLRDFSTHNHKQVDDKPYGGGAGMVLMPDILAKATKAAKTNKDSLVILTDPSGTSFNQKLAHELSQKEELIIISGRYEGVDQRFKDKYVDLEISLGDYVLNGGEAAALVIVETVSRLLPGVLGSEQSLETESFGLVDKRQLLEYPQYTKPAEFEGVAVPEILLSGNHKKIEEWRKNQALEKTKKRRPDLLDTN